MMGDTPCETIALLSWSEVQVSTALRHRPQRKRIEQREATNLVVIPVCNLTMLGIDQDPLQARHACDRASDGSPWQSKPASEGWSFLAEGGAEESALVHAIRAFRRQILKECVGSIEGL